MTFSKRFLSPIIFNAQALLIIATIMAIFISNSSYNDWYQGFFHDNIISYGLDVVAPINLTLNSFINEYLMAIFFILVTLEIKKEMLVGELSSISKTMLPFLAMLGGVIMPAIIFLLININHPENWRAFSTPTATDIAFTYAIICAFGNRIPQGLKIFIVTVAVADDLVAILIIACYFSNDLDFINFFYAAICIAVLYILNRKKVKNLIPYTTVGIVLWHFLHSSGISPTIAGVILAAFIPYEIDDAKPMQNMSQAVASGVNYFILPLFAFANAGVRITDFSLDILLNNLTLGVLLGMFIGKQLGITLVSYILIKLKYCTLPRDTNWKIFYGVSILAGIGFTMNLFMGNLAFSQEEMLNKIRLGVLCGSIISVLVGSAYLSFVTRNKRVS